MSIQEAAEQMRSLDVGVLPVCNGDRLVGMLTDRDLAVRAVANGRDPKSTTVEKIMTGQIACCFEDQDIEEAERVMEKNQIRRLPAPDHDNRIVGIVSLGDLAIKDDEKRVGVTLERISENSRSAFSRPRSDVIVASLENTRLKAANSSYSWLLGLARTCQSVQNLGPMKTSLSSIPTRWISRSLLLVLAATAACTFFSACVGHQARVENRQERRSDRQDRRADRQERRQGESQPTPVPKDQQ